MLPNLNFFSFTADYHKFSERMDSASYYPFCHSTDSTIVLAKGTACFSATEFSTEYRFNAPLSGELKAVELHHVSGGVTSHTSLGYNNWGSFYGDGEPVLLTLLLRENDDGSTETLFPDANTDGITAFSGSDYCTACHVSQYQMDEYDANSDALRWTETGSTISVSTGDVFSLQYSEGCCGLSTSDNAGTSCADVYFEYSSVITGQLSYDFAVNLVFMSIDFYIANPFASQREMVLCHLLYLLQSNPVSMMLLMTFNISK